MFICVNCVCVNMLRSYLFSSLPCVVQETTSLNRSLYQLFPAALYTEQQVFDQDHVLFLAEILQMCPRLVQFDDVISLCIYFCDKHL